MKETVATSTSMTKKSRPNVLQLEGEIDLHVSPEVAESLRTMVAKKPEVLVVDLAKVTYFDSSGLAGLIAGMQKVLGHAGKFPLPSVAGTDHHTFCISRLH